MIVVALRVLRLGDRTGSAVTHVSGHSSGPVGGVDGKLATGASSEASTAEVEEDGVVGGVLFVDVQVVSGEVVVK